MTSRDRVTEYLRQFRRLRDTAGVIHNVHTDPETEGASLTAPDLYAVLKLAGDERAPEPSREDLYEAAVRAVLDLCDRADRRSFSPGVVRTGVLREAIREILAGDEDPTPPGPRRELSSAEEIRQAISRPEASTILLDSGGFVWWGDEDRDGAAVLHGVGTPARAGAHGLAVEAYLNVMSPEEAVHYGPFRIVGQEASQ